jgi:hypothetical protein
MDPSGRSRSNHTRTDLSPVLAILGPGQLHRFRGRLRLYLAGSPVAHAESSSLSFGTNLPSRAAPHPALQRRSCLRLHPGLCLRGGNDFHILSSWFHGRTRLRARRATVRDWTLPCSATSALPTSEDHFPVSSFPSPPSFFPVFFSSPTSSFFRLSSGFDRLRARRATV